MNFWEFSIWGVVVIKHWSSLRAHASDKDSNSETVMS